MRKLEFKALVLPIIVLMLGMFYLGFCGGQTFFRKKDKQASWYLDIRMRTLMIIHRSSRGNGRQSGEFPCNLNGKKPHFP